MANYALPTNRKADDPGLPSDANTVHGFVDLFDTGIASNPAGNVLTWNGTAVVGATPLTTEAVQDAVAALLVPGANVTLTYNDTANTLTVATSATAGLDAEGVRDTIAAALIGTSGVSVTPNDGADTITISGAGAGGGQWEYIPENYYLGGEVVGTSADGEAVQRALDACPDGGTVYLKPGKNYVSTRAIVVHDTTLEGNGAKITGGSVATGINIKLQGVAPTMRNVNVIAGSTVAVAVAFAGSTQQAVIEGGSISGAASAGVDQGVGINSTGIDHVTIQGVHFKHCVYGVLTNSVATDLEDVKIEGCTFDDISGDPIELNHPGSAGTGLKGCVISGNYINARAASDSSGLPGASSAGFGVGIAHANNVTITGNTFYDCRQKGVHVEDTSEHITITGNTFRNCNESIWAIGCSLLTIVGNTIKGGTYGIHLTYDVTNYVRRVIIANNIVTATSNTAIVHETNQNPLCTIQGNIMADNTGKGLEVNAPGSGAVNYLVQGNMNINNTGADTTFVGVAGTVGSNVAI